MNQNDETDVIASLAADGQEHDETRPVESYFIDGGNRVVIEQTDEDGRWIESDEFVEAEL